MEFVLNEYHHNISNEDMLNDVSRVARMLQKSTLTKKEYAKAGCYGADTICRRFGSWLKVLELCELESNQFQVAAAKSSHLHTAVSDNELLNDVFRVSQALGKKSFSSKEYNDLGKYSCSTIFKRFESWNDALEKAGLEPYKRVSEKRIDTVLLFEEIERMWVSLGRQPTVNDLKNGYSKYALNTFSRRFGGWRNALEAFVEWVNKEQSSVQTDGDDSGECAECGTTTQKNDCELPDSKLSLKHKTRREINLRLRFLVMKRDNFKCRICGASPAKDPKIELHVDHIVPWAKGGETTLDNLQTLCSKCNLGKSDLSE